MDQTKNRSWLAILGLSIGILVILLLIFPIVMAILTSGLGLVVTTPLMLLLPVSLVALIINLIANHRIKKHGMNGQKQVRLGLIFSIIGSALGFLLLVLLFLAMASVFGQWI